MKCVECIDLVLLKRILVLNLGHELVSSVIGGDGGSGGSSSCSCGGGGPLCSGSSFVGMF